MDVLPPGFPRPRTLMPVGAAESPSSLLPTTHPARGISLDQSQMPAILWRDYGTGRPGLHRPCACAHLLLLVLSNRLCKLLFHLEDPN